MTKRPRKAAGFVGRADYAAGHEFTKDGGNEVWELTGRGWAMLGGLIALVAFGVVTFVTTGGPTKINDVLDQDQYQDRLDAIGAVYRQGVKAREGMKASGIALPDEATCRDALQRTGADRERSMVESARQTADGKPDVAFKELRALSFVNGCLGRPNALPASPLPPAPSPTPTGS
ncbi:hypothetical protein [Micromonospora fluostatini]|uniref:hypothetical protein n=1 Tax=Micromonospora sp. JCM 30529 TaxID=3421643 RepID=UPI003D173DA0